MNLQTRLLNLFQTPIIKNGLYHYDIPQAGAITTDLALQNPTKNQIKLPDTSTVVIGVNEIIPLAGQSSMRGNTTK